MTLTRRALLSALAALPFVGKWIPQTVSARPCDYLTAAELEHASKLMAKAAFGQIDSLYGFRNVKPECVGRFTEDGRYQLAFETGGVWEYRDGQWADLGHPRTLDRRLALAEWDQKVQG